MYRSTRKKWILSTSILFMVQVVAVSNFLSNGFASQDKTMVSPFVFDKWQVETGELQLGDKLVLYISKNCVRAASEEDPGRAPVAMNFLNTLQSTPDLSLTAVNFEITDMAQIEDLHQSIGEDVCVSGVANDMTFQATQFNDDPRNSAQDYLKTIHAEASYDLLWGSSVAIDLPAGEEVVIAVVDTGVDANHEDLASVIWTNDAGNFGFDFVNNDTNPTDDQGHGSHVAGLAAAKSSNGVGISGVMGFQAKIMAVKVLDQNGSGSLANISNGIRFAADNGADVINLSLGGRGANAGLRDALIYAVGKGVSVFVAAGNNGELLTTGNIYSPASYAQEIEGTMAVGSIDAIDRTRSSFSNVSTTYVEIAAPGSGPASILSTFSNNRYAALQGTSMATPIVSGAAGLVIGFLRSHGQPATPARVEEILTATAISEESLSTLFKEGRVLDLESLVRYLESTAVIQSNGGLSADF